jgi:ABC-type lipoprotein release transport system permease subunit
LRVRRRAIPAVSPVRNDPHDTVAFASATIVLCVVALVACAAPALRASRVSPVTALRVD